MNVKLIASLAITCFVLLFLFQNADLVEIQILFWTISMSRSLLIFLLVGIGVLIGWLLNSYFSIKRK